MEIAIVEPLMSFDNDNPGRIQPDFEGEERYAAKLVVGR